MGQPAAEWALLEAAGAVSCLAATVVLQAVDGIALKAMVDLWAATQHSGQGGALSGRA